MLEFLTTLRESPMWDPADAAASLCAILRAAQAPERAAIPARLRHAIDDTIEAYGDDWEIPTKHRVDLAVALTDSVAHVLTPAAAPAQDVNEMRPISIAQAAKNAAEQRTHTSGGLRDTAQPDLRERIAQAIARGRGLPRTGPSDYNAADAVLREIAGGSDRG